VLTKGFTLYLEYLVYLHYLLEHSFRPSDATPVVLVDQVFPNSLARIEEIEQYILSPVLHMSTATLAVAGRGRQPIWSNHQLQQAKTINLSK
jgi:hypothetical protein